MRDSIKARSNPPTPVFCIILRSRCRLARPWSPHLLILTVCQSYGRESRSRKCRYLFDGRDVFSHASSRSYVLLGTASLCYCSRSCVLLHGARRHHYYVRLTGWNWTSPVLVIAQSKLCAPGAIRAHSRSYCPVEVVYSWGNLLSHSFAVVDVFSRIKGLFRRSNCWWHRSL